MNGISPDLKLFIQQYIDSVELLEVLLLLSKWREREWSANEVNAVLKSSSASIQSRLGFLESVRLATGIDGDPRRFKYGPVPDETNDHVVKLAEAYVQYRLQVIDTIYARDRIRLFADAFKIRSDKDDK